MSEGAIVLFSGGIDSTACLLWALQHFSKVFALSVDYGQTRKELEAGRLIAKRLEVSRHVVKIDGMVLSGAVRADRVENYIVPARNAVLIAIAANHRRRFNARHVVAGFHKADGADFSDTREPFLSAIQWALSAAGEPIELHTPVMNKPKIQLGTMIPSDILSMTWSCYHDDNEQCGACPSCRQGHFARRRA